MIWVAYKANPVDPPVCKCMLIYAAWCMLRPLRCSSLQGRQWLEQSGTGRGSSSTVPHRNPKTRTFLGFVSSPSPSHLCSQITSPSSAPTSITPSPRTRTWMTRSQCRNPAICTSKPPVLHVCQGYTCFTVLLARSYQGKQTQICPAERPQLQINMKLGSSNCCMEQSKPLVLASSTSNF